MSSIRIQTYIESSNPENIASQQYSPNWEVTTVIWLSFKHSWRQLEGMAACETVTTSDDGMAMVRGNVISYPILELIKAKSKI